MNALTILKELILITALLTMHTANWVSAVAYAIAVRLALPACIAWLVLPTGVPSIFTLIMLAWVGPVGLAFWVKHLWGDDTNDDDDNEGDHL